MTIDGNTGLIAHLGWPTHAFRAPLIYNPYFESAGVNAVVVPMGCKPDAFKDVLRGFFRLENARGALVTMPHKVSVVALLDEASPAVKVAGALHGGGVRDALPHDPLPVAGHRACALACRIACCDRRFAR